MKLFVVTFAVCLASLVFAQSVPADGVQSSVEYLPPVGEGSAPFADDGYRYKAVRRLKYRHRREVPSEEYLPPVAEPSGEYIPPEGAETRVADDGYRYKTVRRLKFRRHRCEAEVAAAENVDAPNGEYFPPSSDVAEVPEVKSAELAQDGYRYKTVRRLKYRRNRREIEAAEEVVAAESADAPNGEYLTPSNDVAEAPEPKSAELAEDGYRYKTLRRIRYRHRQ